MKIAILSRPGGCFPNIISLGLGNMLDKIGVEHTVFYDAIPMLMRLLPLREKPKRWSNSLHFRIYNKLKHAGEDRTLLRKLSSYDLVVVAECLPNALWKNYLAVETLRQHIQKPVVSYNDGPIASAPIHKKMLLDNEDYDESRYDGSLFLTDIIESKAPPTGIRRKVIGLNIASQGLTPVEKKEFVAIVDFRQPGYEMYREQQLRALQQLNIKTIVLEGRYELQDIRNFYRQASIFFMAFPETFGLPVAECLATGTCIFTPNSAWPMAWRTDENPMPWGPGSLPDCFRVYNNEEQLIQQLQQLRDHYHSVDTPQHFFHTFLQHYQHYYEGDVQALSAVLAEF